MNRVIVEENKKIEGRETILGHEIEQPTDHQEISFSADSI